MGPNSGILDGDVSNDFDCLKPFIEHRQVGSPNRPTLTQEDRGMIISKTKTKESVKECNVSGEFYEALDKKVHEMIKTAEQRAVANGRKTVRPCDL